MEVENINHYFSEQVIVPERLFDEQMETYYIEVNGEPVAFGRYSITRDSSCLDNIYTSPHHRGKEYGYALCTAMLNDLKRKGVK